MATSIELHKVPRRTWVKVSKAELPPPAGKPVGVEDDVFFDHIDGMYSFCIDCCGDVVHLKAWTKVTICENQDRAV